MTLLTHDPNDNMTTSTCGGRPFSVLTHRDGLDQHVDLCSVLMKHMRNRTEFLQAGLLSVVFLVLVVGLGLLEQEYAVGTFTNPVLVVVALVPIVVFLAATGRLQRFSGGGFEIELQAQARKFVTPDASRTIDVDPERLDAKNQTGALATVKQRAPTTLTFELGRQGFYVHGAIEAYLDGLETLNYVVFTDADDRFEAYVPVEAFRRLVANYAIDVVGEIESGVITDRPIVRTEAIRSDRTNEECLRTMDELNVDQLAVVDADGTFVGVVHQDAIIRRLVSSALTEV